MTEHKVTVPLLVKQVAYLDQLVGTGNYGKTREDAAAFLIARGLEERMGGGLIRPVLNPAPWNKALP